MVVERGICSGAGKDLVTLSKGYVNVGPIVSEPLGKTEINNIDFIAFTTSTNQKIGGFNVAMNEVEGVDAFYS